MLIVVGRTFVRLTRRPARPAIRVARPASAACGATSVVPKATAVPRTGLAKAHRSAPPTAFRPAPATPSHCAPSAPEAAKSRDRTGQFVSDDRSPHYSKSNIVSVAAHRLRGLVEIRRWRTSSSICDSSTSSTSVLKIISSSCSDVGDDPKNSDPARDPDPNVAFSHKQRSKTQPCRFARISFAPRKSHLVKTKVALRLLHLVKIAFLNVHSENVPLRSAPFMYASVKSQERTSPPIVVHSRAPTNRQLVRRNLFPIRTVRAKSDFERST